MAFSFDGDWNCFEIFNNISAVLFYENDVSFISSDPSRVCFCNENRLPDCVTLLSSTTHSLYPGQNIDISAVTVGQDFGTVAWSVYAQYLNRSHSGNLIELDHSEKMQSVTQYGCNLLKYTIYSPNNVFKLILVLTAQKTAVYIHR